MSFAARHKTIFKGKLLAVKLFLVKICRKTEQPAQSGAQLVRLVVRSTSENNIIF